MGLDKPNYTQIPNLLLDDLMLYMSGAELKVTLAIARQTFGYHRERFPLTISDIEKLTGMSRPAVVEAIEVGERRGLIHRDELPNGRFAYSLIVNDEVMACAKESLPPSVKKVNHAGGKESLPPAVKKVNRRSKESLPPAVKEVNQNTPTLKKGKESSKEKLVGGDPTNQPTNSQPVNSPALQALANTLLIKVGIGGGTAKRLADAYAFVEIRRQVATWLPDHQAGKVAVGALITRIESGWGCPDLSREFRHSQLYRQFRTPDEIEADEAAEAEAHARIAEMEAQPPAAAQVARPSPKPASLPVSVDDPWAIVVADLCRAQPADWPARDWLSSSRLRAMGDVTGVPLYRVEVADADAVGWLNNRLAIQLRRSLSVLLKKPVLIEIVAAEPATEPTP